MRSLLVLGVAVILVVGPTRSAAQTADVEACPLARRASTARTDGWCALTPLRLPAIAVVPQVGGDRALALLPVRFLATGRSGYSAERERGPLWAGRGMSGLASVGIVFRDRWLTVAVEPVLTGAQNLFFVLPDTVAPFRSRYADPWTTHRLDRFLRPGEGPSLAVGLGESMIEADLGDVRAGLSHERIAWGAPQRYPLLFSGHGPGFPHAYVGTDPDIATVIGTFGLDVLVGRLGESSWFDADAGNDTRMISALQFRWRSEHAPGLEIEYAIARHEPLPDGTVEADQFLQLLTGDPEGEAADRRGSSLGVLGARIAPPGSGMEVYAQVGRGEAFLNTAPDGGSDARLAGIFTLGFARTGLGPTGPEWSIRGEVTRQALELPQPGPGSSPPVEAAIRHGHSHRGRLLGSPIGPGSDAQYLEFEQYVRSARWGLFAERVRRDEDTYYRVHSDDYGVRGHDVEWALGLTGAWTPDALDVQSPPVSVAGRVRASRRKNRDFIGLVGEVNRVFLREWDLSLDVYLRWDVARSLSGPRP